MRQLSFPGTGAATVTVCTSVPVHRFGIVFLLLSNVALDIFAVGMCSVELDLLEGKVRHIRSVDGAGHQAAWLGSSFHPD